MKSQLKYVLKFLKYRLTAKHQKGHGIHSPFIFELITKVFNHKTVHKDLKEVFCIHNKYKKSNIPLVFNEIGAGSQKTTNKTKAMNAKMGLYHRKVEATVGKTIRNSSITKKHGRLIYQLIKYFKPSEILEFGTSVGISTLYIAKAAPKSNITTVEGVKEKSAIAQKLAQEMNITNINFMCAEFDSGLTEILEKFNKLDFVFFDGNHTQKATLNYFNACLEKAHNDSIFIFDDIHWSKEMEEAWDAIKNHKKVKVSIDLFRLGIIFFKPEITAGNYVIKF